MQSNSLLDMLEGRAQPDPEMVAALERLRRGQEWMTVTWRTWRDVDPWPEDVEKPFNDSLDKWEELEQDTRRRWKLEGCVIGPQGCHPDAPMRCSYCAEHQSQEPSGMGSPETPYAATGSGAALQIKEAQAQQPSLFSMSRGHL